MLKTDKLSSGAKNSNYTLKTINVRLLAEPECNHPHHRRCIQYILFYLLYKSIHTIGTQVLLCVPLQLLESIQKAFFTSTSCELSPLTSDQGKAGLQRKA